MSEIKIEALTEREIALAMAAANLTPDDFTGDDMPKVDALNIRLEADGQEKTTKEERDTAWPRIVALRDAGGPAPDPLPDPDDGPARIRITAAHSNPVVVYIHGRALCSLRIGEEAIVPREALAALRASDVTFEEK